VGGFLGAGVGLCGGFVSVVAIRDVGARMLIPAKHRDETGDRGRNIIGRL